jgi:histidyl-tRNA synthetase
MAAFQAIRGMHDILPEQTPSWRRLERRIGEVLEAHGYREIRLPILEMTELFARSIGATTDIVEKEMYTFDDRNGDSLSLRPEGTAGCVRAGLEHGLLHNKTPRLWYAGPMFRHEKPQRGRLRQFHQIGVEAFGLPGPEIDAEVILMTRVIWQHLQLGGLCLELNSLGTPACRERYKAELVRYFGEHESQLDEDSRRRLQTNPLRILDSKNPDLAGLIAAAPTLEAFLDAESRAHFDQLRSMLDAASLDYRVNSRLVRGLDYYSKTVFEWTTDRLGAQSTVCAGGRYDGLVELFGGRATPAVGFAMGLERLIELLQSADTPNAPQAVMLTLGEAARARGPVLADELRRSLPELQLTLDLGSGNLKRQLRRAYDSGARLCLILGEAELADEQILVRPLQTDGEQQLAIAGLGDYLREKLIL